MLDFLEVRVVKRGQQCGLKAIQQSLLVPNELQAFQKLGPIVLGEDLGFAVSQRSASVVNNLTICR